jgi:hypothetical protein
MMAVSSCHDNYDFFQDISRHDQFLSRVKRRKFGEASLEQAMEEKGFIA